MGYLGSASWQKVWILSVPTLACITYFYFKCHELDVILLGDDEAKSLGVDTQRMKKSMFIVASLCVAFSVAFTGLIGFVGLIIPHTIRILLKNSSNAILISLSVLFVALFLLLCDTTGRTILDPVEIPIGIITAFFGAPFFLYLASLSLFYTLAKDMIQFSFVGGSHGSGRGSIIYENLNRTQQLGLELNFEQNLDDLSLRTSLSLIKARINKGAKADSPIPRVPKGKFTLGADYQLIQQLSLFGDFSIYGSSTSSDNTRIKAYSLASVGLKSSFLGFNLDAGVKNLFNSQYNIYESKSSFVPGAGRSYYLQTQYTF